MSGGIEHLILSGPLLFAVVMPIASIAARPGGHRAGPDDCAAGPNLSR